MMSRQVLSRSVRTTNHLKQFKFIRTFASRDSNSPINAIFPNEDEDDEKIRNSLKKVRKPNLVNLEKKWTQLNLLAQDNIISYLEDRMHDDWKTLTIPEKKAIWFLYFGPWGPREPNQSEPGRYYKHFIGIIALIGLGLGGYKYLADESKSPEKNQET